MRVWLMVLVLAGGLALPASAAERVYLQVEAQPTLAQAQAAAARYAEVFGDVVGYALGSGWYAIALGPFPDREAGTAAGRSLRASGQVPRDAFVVEAARTAARFWPDGAAAEVPGDLDGAADPEVAQEELPEAVAEPVVEPEETLAQARQAEAALDREARAEVQTALAWFGHYELAIDAAFGPGTRRAMADWQAARGLDPTGVLTTRQRGALLESWRAERGAYGFAPWRDAGAGIEVTLPAAMVAFDRVEAPFVRFAPVDGSGVEVVLISQQGTPATLAGLYEVLQSLEAMPPGGPRDLGRDAFTLTGRDGARIAHAETRLAGGQIKGFLLVWPTDQPVAMDRALAEMQASFRSVGPALPGGLGVPESAVAATDLVAGLEIRRPIRTLTGFFIDGSGRVLTSAALAEGCGRLTIEARHGAEVYLQDAGLGVAVLAPAEPLAPAAYARFAEGLPALRSEVVLAGFALPEMTVPVLTTGRLAALEGMAGEAGLRRLALQAEPGEIGGPVLDSSGAVLGMLLPPDTASERILPGDVSFAAGAEAILALLRSNGVEPTVADAAGPVDLPTLQRGAAGMTVQVACWD